MADTPTWFRVVVACGVLVRLYLCLFTEGTYDVNIWEKHADRVAQVGVIAYYHENEEANHPPFISKVMSYVLLASKASRIPFRVLERLPFAVIDAGTLWLLLAVLKGRERGLWIAAAYWLHPLAVIYSSYHGNTDSSLPFFVLLAAWLITRKQTAWAAVVAGASLWIKLPAVVALPALLILIDGWRDRVRFAAVAGATAIATYLPALAIDAKIVIANVFGYHGQFIETTGGVSIWGWYRVLMPMVVASPEWLETPPRVVQLLVLRGYGIALALNLLVVWRRRNLRTLPEVCATIAMGYTLIYGISETWAFQYFAWSVPFWCFMPLWFFVAATALAGGYIYFLYAYLCGSPWLAGAWDFIGHPLWPAHVVALRDLAVGFFLVTAIWIAITARLPQPASPKR